MGNLTQITGLGKYYTEYFDIINRYKDITRHSNFCLYLNVNTKSSIYNEDTNSTYSRFEHGVIYDSYDYTPLQTIDPITNSSSTDTNTVGFKFIGESRVVVYTIKTPQINDLIIFPYAPNNLNEIFRVKEITVPLNARNTGANYFFQLAIEYASIKSIDKLKINNEYVYLITKGININKVDYINSIQDISTLDALFKNTNFHEYYELYYNKDNIISLDENLIIYEFLKKFRDYFSLNIRVPFGILNYLTTSARTVFAERYKLIVPDADNIPTIDLMKVNLINKILNYEHNRS